MEVDKLRQDKETKRMQREIFKRRLQTKDSIEQEQSVDNRDPLKLDKASHSVDSKDPVKFDMNGRKIRQGSVNTSNIKTRWSRGNTNNQISMNLDEIDPRMMFPKRSETDPSLDQPSLPNGDMY